MTKQDISERFGRWISLRLPRGRGFGRGDYNLPAGITCRELARLCGVDASLVSLWAAGHYLPTRQSCQAIAKAFGEPVDLVLLLAGHAPEGNPERIYRTLTSTLTGHQTRQKEVALCPVNRFQPPDP